MKRPHDARRLDVARFAAEAGVLAGAWPGEQLDRLADSQSPPQDTPLAAVDWSVQGEARPVTGGEPELWLTLQARTTAWLTCQRCLQPLAEALAIDRRIRFVRGEAEAEALDAESEDDVLALARSLDLRELIEDELLLALPLVPRHDRCPRPLPVDAQAAAAPVAEPDAHPFAVLKGLKRGGAADQ
jgi:uncharacterized protein